MKVRALLKTPLYRQRATDGETPYVDGNVTEVRGKAEVRDGGLDIKVSALIGAKGEAVDSTVKRLFLPLAKIDYYIVEDK